MINFTSSYGDDLHSPCDLSSNCETPSSVNLVIMDRNEKSCILNFAFVLNKATKREIKATKMVTPSFIFLKASTKLCTMYEENGC